MSKDKDPSIFSKSNGGYCVILQIFLVTRAVLGNILVARLDQSRASENI